MAEDGVLSEPLSNPEFPANREKYREICSFQDYLMSQHADSMNVSGSKAKSEQGINSAYQGIVLTYQGFSVRYREINFSEMNHHHRFLWGSTSRLSDSQPAYFVA